MPSAARLNHRHQPSTTSTVSSSSSSSSSRPALQRILTNSPSNAVHLSRSTAPTSRRVRSHWFSHFAVHWRRSSRTSKLLFASTLALVAIQVIATVVVLTFSWDMYCDKPLRVFLTVYILRVFLSAPLSVYLHLAPRRRRQQQQEQQEQQDNNRHHSHQNSNPGSDSIVDAEAGTSYMLTDRRQNPTNSLPPNSEHDTSLSSWIDRAKSALDMFALLWFIIGNYMLFTSTTCSETAVPLYYLSFVIIIYGYVVLSVPILLCTAVIFCLPCVLVGMRILHVEDAEDMGGASKDEIARIPVYRFKSHSNIPATTEDMEMHELPQKPQQQEQVVREQTHSFWSQLQTRFGLSNESDDQRHIEHEPELDTIEIPNEQDRVCAICLSTYDDGDILCKLWCNHHFHKTCVHEWLVLNSRCPMCKRDSRGKQYPAMDC